MNLEYPLSTDWGLSYPVSTNDRFGRYGSGASIPVDNIGLLHAASRPLRSSVRPSTVWIIEEDASGEACFTPWPLIHRFYLSSHDGSAQDLLSGFELRLRQLVGAAPQPAPEILTPQEQLAEATHTFSLPASQLAAIFDVSRQTIYNWKRGSNIFLKRI